MSPGTYTMRSSLSRWFLLISLVLIACIALVPAGRGRAKLWGNALFGGEDAISIREAVIQSVPYRYQARLRRQLGPDVAQASSDLPMPPPPAADAPWPLSKYAIISQTVWSAEFLNIHYSRLEEGGIAHEVHQHDEEEILIPIQGDVEIQGRLATQRLSPGNALYYASQDPHTIGALGPGPATYVAWRWKQSTGDPENKLEGKLLQLTDALRDGLERARGGESVKQSVLDGETRWLERLYAHLRSLPAGGSIAAHEDEHDAVLVLLHGTIETQGETLTAPAVAFNPAFTEHGVVNPGPDVAQYLAVDMKPR